jgi:alpha-glucoside transport system substrate-binding protein
VGLKEEPDPTGAIIWEDISMKTRFFTSAAALALVAGGAHAQDLMFPVGEGDFNWDSYQAFADSAPDLSGQTVTIAGPWLSPEADRFDILLTYFEGRDRRRGDLHRVRQLRAADRHRRGGGLCPQHRRLPAAGPAADMAARGLLTPLGDDMGAGSPKTTPQASPGSIWAPMPTPTAQTSSTASSST